MFDRFLNHVSYPTLPITTTSSLLPPLLNENNGHLFVTSRSNTGNPPHVGLSDNITFVDRGLDITTNFHLRTGHQVAPPSSNLPEHKPRYHVEILEQLKSDPKTNTPCKLHHGTGIQHLRFPPFQPIFLTPALLTTHHL